MNRRSQVLAALAMSLVLAACTENGARQGSAATPVSSAPEAATPASAVAAPAHSRAWWNRPHYVEALNLSETQREQMDAALGAHLKARREMAEAYNVARRQLGERLATGDWAAAEKIADHAGQILGTMARSEGELAIAVARILEPAQREQLEAEFPALLQRPLVQGSLGRQGGRPRRR